MPDLVDAVVVPGFAGTSMPAWLARRLDRGLAGVCWFGHNLIDERQARLLADDLHGVRDGALVLCDEEGGDVTRLEAAAGSWWPSHAALGRLDETSTTHRVAAAMGRSVRAAGVDVALAPVVDVNSDLRNPVIGTRSFGSDPALVARHGAAFVTGLQESGVAACAKHFPGHGSTTADSHIELPHVDAPAATLRERDIAPFGAAVEAGVRCVMTAHVVFSALDERPATMSPKVLTLLRRELGFDGVIMGDALDMHAISRGVGRGAGAVQALVSGVDLICIGNPCFPEPYDAEASLDDVTDAIRAAVREGTVTTQRLEQAASRVAALAAWVRQPDGPSRSAWSDRCLGYEVASRVLQSSGDVTVAAPPLVIQVDGPLGMAAGPRGSPMVASFRELAPGTDVVSATSPADVVALGRRFAERPVVVIVGQRRSAGSQDLLTALLAVRPDAVMVYTGLPQPDDRGACVVHTFGGGRAAARAVADLVMSPCGT